MQNSPSDHTFDHSLRDYLKRWPSRHHFEVSDRDIQPIYDAMVNFFEGDEWPIIKEENAPVLYTTFQGDHGRWLCLSHAYDDDRQIVFYSLYPDPVPVAQRDAIALFITRANYGLMIGNFECDLDSGDLRYKTSLNLEGSTLTPALMNAIVYTNVLTMDQYLPGIQAVIKHNVDVQTAIQMTEKL